jgi:hypothetical protein
MGTHLGDVRRDAPSASYAPPAAPRESGTMTSAEPWSPAQRIGFRFLFAYLVLYNLPFPLATPFYGPSGPYRAIWHAVVPWVGAHVLHLAQPITTFEGGSSDTTYHYVQLLCFLALAVLATVVWSLLDRSRRDYRKLNEYLRIYIRYSLAATMLVYGVFKIIKAQFPFPGFEGLLESYGESSPARLLWNMMGYSTPYNIYAGLLEASAVLLFWRRTTTLGALLAIGAMSNVAMLNFSYDVPVKLFATHLLLMAVYLVAPRVPSLIDVFVRNRGAAPEPTVPLATGPRARRLRLAVKSLAVFIAVGVPGTMALLQWKNFSANRARPPLYGLYDVERFVRDGVDVPPLVTDSTRWRYVIVEYPGSMAVRSMTGSRRGFAARVDTVLRHVTLRSPRDSTHTSILAYAPAGPGRLRFTGAVDGDSLDVIVRRHDASEFLLVNRGFHWINERPFMP